MTNANPLVLNTITTLLGIALFLLILSCLHELVIYIIKRRDGKDMTTPQNPSGA